MALTNPITLTEYIDKYMSGFKSIFMHNIVSRYSTINDIINGNTKFPFVVSVIGSRTLTLPDRDNTVMEVPILLFTSGELSIDIKIDPVSVDQVCVYTSSMYSIDLRYFFDMMSTYYKVGSDRGERDWYPSYDINNKCFGFSMSKIELLPSFVIAYVCAVYSSVKPKRESMLYSESLRHALAGEV